MKSDNTNNDNVVERRDVVKEWEAIKSKFSWATIRYVFEPKWLRAWLAIKTISIFSSIFFWVILTALCVFTIYLSYVAPPGTLVDPKIQSILRDIVSRVFADLPTTTGPWGQLGDFFGGVLNPIIGLATIYLLVQSVTLQRKELAATRKAMEETRQEMEEQSKQMKIQSFESTLFNQLKIYKSFVESFKSSDGDSIDGLNNYINNALQSLDLKCEYYITAEGRKYIQQIEALRSEINGIGLNIIREFEVFTYPMINNFLLLIRWVDSTELLDAPGRMRYCELIRAQLTIGELKLIYFFTTLNHNSSELTNFCLKYGILGNLDLGKGVWKFLLQVPISNKL